MSDHDIYTAVMDAKKVRSVDVLGCCFHLETHQLHHRNPYLEICWQQHMGYKPPNSYGVWDMGFGVKIPANQLGKCENVCGMREYGLYGVWVTRESTVVALQVLRVHRLTGHKSTRGGGKSDV